MRDSVVGDLVYDEFWERPESIRLFGKEQVVTLSFEGEADEELDAGQRQAFVEFNQRRTELLAEAEKGVLEYYVRLAPDYRRRFGREDAARRVPAVSDTADLGAIAVPTELWFPRTLHADERVVGILFDCTWEPGLGLAVKFVNERLSEVGTQDIVL